MHRKQQEHTSCVVLPIRCEASSCVTALYYICVRSAIVCHDVGVCRCYSTRLFCVGVFGVVVDIVAVTNATSRDVHAGRACFMRAAAAGCG